MGRVCPDREPCLLALGSRLEVDVSCHLAGKMLLSASDEGDGRAVIEPGCVAKQTQRSRALRKGPHVRSRSAQKVPRHAQGRAIEIIARGRGFPGDGSKCWTLLH